MPLTRLSWMRFLYVSVQRREPTPAPARLTTASHPASPAVSTRPASGSHRTSVSSRGSRRTRRTTSYPSAVRERTRAEPISPDAPATAILESCMTSSCLVGG